jgi:glycosyltransferase involved in cell wall biosynthesis
MDGHLLSVGDGEPKLLLSLNRLTNELRIADRVTFSGAHPDAKQVIAALDVLVLPYAIEPFGRVLLEAWSLSTPVVLSRIGGIESIVRHDQEGLLVDYGDINGLAKAIEDILQDQNLRASLVRSSKERCLLEFSIESYAARMEEVYLSILNLESENIS